MKTFHCRVEKPFDRYDNPGAIAALSESGFSRMNQSARFRGHVTVLCIEQPNGDVTDADGSVVITSKERKGAPVDPVAVAELIAQGAAAQGDLAPSDRQEKKSRTRG